MHRESKNEKEGNSNKALLKQLLIDLYREYLAAGEAKFNVDICSTLLELNFEQVIGEVNLRQILRDIHVDIIRLRNKSVEFRIRPCEILEYSIEPKGTDKVIKFTLENGADKREIQFLLARK